MKKYVRENGNSSKVILEIRRVQFFYIENFWRWGEGDRLFSVPGPKYSDYAPGDMWSTAGFKERAFLMKRFFNYPVIKINEMIEWKKQLLYLGVELDNRLSFRPHIHKMMKKGIHTGANLSLIMPNVGGPKEKKQRLLASVVHSRMLYAAPIWSDALEKKYTGDMLTKAQRYVALRIISGYRTVSRARHW